MEIVSVGLKEILPAGRVRLRTKQYSKSSCAKRGKMVHSLVPQRPMLETIRKEILHRQGWLSMRMNKSGYEKSRQMLYWY